MGILESLFGNPSVVGRLKDGKCETYVKKGFFRMNEGHPDLIKSAIDSINELYENNKDYKGEIRIEIY